MNYNYNISDHGFCPTEMESQSHPHPRYVNVGA